MADLASISLEHTIRPAPLTPIPHLGVDASWMGVSQLLRIASAMGWIHLPPASRGDQGDVQLRGNLARSHMGQRFLATKLL